MKQPDPVRLAVYYAAAERIEDQYQAEITAWIKATPNIKGEAPEGAAIDAKYDALKAKLDETYPAEAAIAAAENDADNAAFDALHGFR